MPKILVVRFSSIGDIVLTTPVLRCIKNQVPGASLHFVTKSAYTSLLSANPHIDKIHTFDGRMGPLMAVLKKEKFDFVVDLHHNLRSYILKRRLKIPSAAYPKLNFEKWLVVNWKVNRLPQVHIVERYLQTLVELGVHNDRLGLEHYIPAETKNPLADLPGAWQQGYVAIAIGAQHATKKMPVARYRKFLEHLFQAAPHRLVILLGGTEDAAEGEAIATGFEQVVNLSGKCSIQQSALVLQQASLVISHDTGMMHLAAALQKKVISIWGNTIPEFGMYPYYGEERNLDWQKNQGWIVEQENLPCRPCSKIGHNQCPKGHFNCMQQVDTAALALRVEAIGKV